MELVLVLITTILSVMRLAGVKHIAFQAVAHLFVGGLFGAYFVGKDKSYLWLAIVISIVEVIAAAGTFLQGL